MCSERRLEDVTQNACPNTPLELREWCEGTGEGGDAVDEPAVEKVAVGIDEDRVGTDDSAMGATLEGTGGGEHGGSGQGARQMDEIVDFASSGMLCDFGGSRRMSVRSDCWRSWCSNSFRSRTGTLWSMGAERRWAGTRGTEGGRGGVHDGGRSRMPRLGGEEYVGGGDMMVGDVRP